MSETSHHRHRGCQRIHGGVELFFRGFTRSFFFDVFRDEVSHGDAPFDVRIDRRCRHCRRLQPILPPRLNSKVCHAPFELRARGFSQEPIHVYSVAGDDASGNEEPSESLGFVNCDFFSASNL